MARAAKATSTPKTPAAPKGPSTKLVEFEAGSIKEALKEVTSGNRTCYMVPMDLIRTVPGFNLRVTDAVSYKDGIKSLAAKITREGFSPVKPIGAFVAKDGEQHVVVVIDGHRRYEAAKLAIENGMELDRLPILLYPPGTTPQELNEKLVTENEGAEPLNILEKALNAHRLVTSGLTEAEVAEKLGFTPRYVTDLLKLMATTKAVRDHVKAGRISGTEVVKIASKHKDKKETEAAVNAAVEKASHRGKGRATAGTSEATSGVAGRMARTTITYGLAKGSKAPVSDIMRFRDLFSDQKWYEIDDEKPGVFTATENFEIKVVIRRERKAAEEEPVGREVDPMSMQEIEGDEDETEIEGDEDDVPDLATLGIADRSGDTEGL